MSVQTHKHGADNPRPQIKLLLIAHLEQQHGMTIKHPALTTVEALRDDHSGAHRKGAGNGKD